MCMEQARSWDRHALHHFCPDGSSHPPHTPNPPSFPAAPLLLPTFCRTQLNIYILHVPRPELRNSLVLCVCGGGINHSALLIAPGGQAAPRRMSCVTDHV